MVGHKMQFVKDVRPMTNLNEIVQFVKPNVLIGNYHGKGLVYLNNYYLMNALPMFTMDRCFRYWRCFHA